MKRKLEIFIVLLIVIAICSLILAEIKQHFSKKDESNNGISTYSDATHMDATSSDAQHTYYKYSEIENMILKLANTSDIMEELDRLVDPLSGSEYVTVGYIRKTVNIIGVDDSVYPDEFSVKTDSEKLLREDFDYIYDAIIDLGISNGVRKETVYALEYINVHNTLFDGENTYTISCGYSNEYTGCLLDVYIKDYDIYRIKGLSDKIYTIENVWIISVDNVCTVLYGDKILEYDLCSTASIGDSDGGDYAANINISNEGLTSIIPLREKENGRVIYAVKDGIRLQYGEQKMFADDYQVYNTFEEPYNEGSIGALTGYEDTTLFFDDEGKVCVVDVNSGLISDDIRVILSDETGNNYDMQNVILTSDTAFTISYGEGGEAVREAGYEVSIDTEEYLAGDVIIVEPNKTSGRINILSISKSYGTPSYRGTIEIHVYEDYVNIINVLPLEEYLYSVVSSEMPASSSEEALKAMAVSARAYAWSRIYDAGYDSYNADIDDTSLCQIYNNVEEYPAAVKAVKDTYSIVPVYDSSVIIPFNYLTSYGVSCTNDDIWGGTAYGYLSDEMDSLDKEVINLSDEEAFMQFINDGTSYSLIDKEEPYFRWSISFTTDEFSDAVNSALEDRLSISADNITLKTGDEIYEQSNITDIGEINSISVIDRSDSGVVEALEIEGSLATIRVTGQTNIRNIINPVEEQIIRKDGSTVTGWTSLPSPFYYIEKTTDGYTVYGGGFGNGIGMSKNGANNLAEAGYNYEYILKHYYNDIVFDRLEYQEPEQE